MVRLAAVIASVCTLAGCGARRMPQSDLGVPRCAADGRTNLLSASALQCWFDAPHGRWRTLSHESHYQVLVVEVEAADLADADDIARRFVADQEAAFSEILVYARREPAQSPARVRRIRWTRSGGFETLDFSVPR
jgi:hypothetical protein